MQPARAKLRRDAIEIWLAGVDAVCPSRLVPQWLRVEGRTLVIGKGSSNSPLRLALDEIRRIAVLGGGKAAAGMAEAVEAVLGPEWMAEKELVGWVNVPADCTGRASRIHLHPARPPGVNEPTPAGLAGSEEILRLAGSLGPDDLCLCLVSGGGSALMPAPVEGVSLADKLAITRYLSAAGANIEELNTVRKPLSRIKGGGLLRSCRAGRLVALVISDVLGNPLSLIASGPTVPEEPAPRAALEVLARFHAEEAGIAPAAFAHLRAEERRVRKRGQSPFGRCTLRAVPANGDCPLFRTEVHNLVIGDNATAVAAAAEEARRRGYDASATSASHSEGPAEEVGRALAELALRMRAAPGMGFQPVEDHGQDGRATCSISGGEPVVTLVDPQRRGRGGRNQQLALAALVRLLGQPAEGLALLSGGTDGEDGPTDAAGAVVDAEVLAAARLADRDPADYLARNDAYAFFDPLGALLKTGPTQTNVCDLRVVLAVSPTTTDPCRDPA
jgi:hydroxypyruvate reductase